MTTPLEDPQVQSIMSADNAAAITDLACLVTGTPSACLNLIDDNEYQTVANTNSFLWRVPTDNSICRLVMESAESLYIPDCTKDARVADNPFVNGTFGAIKTYATAPLLDRDGNPFGTLCVASGETTHLSPAALAGLGMLAAQAAAVLELTDRNSVLSYSNDELETFAARAAHDLSSPLMSFMWMIEMLIEATPELTPQSRHLIDRMRATTEHMNTLLGGLLTLASAKNAAIEAVPVDFNRVVATTLTSLHGLIANRRAIIHVGELPMVVGDPTQLTQLVSNLVSNAISHAGEKHRPEIFICARQLGDNWCIDFDDNGPGIPVEQRDQVFKPFERLAETDGRNGLGLAITKTVALRHGGNVWVEQSPSGGARFCVSLPIAH